MTGTEARRVAETRWTEPEGQRRIHPCPLFSVTKATGYSSTRTQGTLHIHVRKGAAVAKFWLAPLPEVAESHGLSAHELAEVLDVALEHAEEIERYWNEYFGG